MPTLTRKEWLLLALGALALFFLHTHFRVTGFGEQDAARLASDAINWHFEGSIDATQVDYRLHTSPLYIHALKLSLDHGLPIRALPRVMNGASVFLSSACVVGLYLLFRRFATAAVSAAAVTLYALTPTFWLGSIYGMPTLPALTFLVCSGLAFGAALDVGSLRKPQFAAFIALSAVLATVAFSLKADMALSSGVLLSVLMTRGKFRPVLLPFILLIVGLATGITVVYAHHLSVPVALVAHTHTHAVSGFLESWSTRFPFKWTLLTDPKNNAPISHAAGTLLFAVCLLALLQGLCAGGRRTRLTLAMAAWGLPSLLFWGLKPGNSARHNLPAFAPLVFLAALMLFQLVDNQARRAWPLFVLLFALGQLDETGIGSVTPRADLLVVSEQVQHSSSELHGRAREFMASSSPKKAIIETEYLLTYSEFEAWAAAKSPRLSPRPKTILDGADHETRIVLVGNNVRSARAQAQRLRDQGFTVFSLQFSL